MVFCEHQASFSTVANAAPENCAAGLHDQSSPPNLIAYPQLSEDFAVHRLNEHAGHQLSSSTEAHDA